MRRRDCLKLLSRAVLFMLASCTACKRSSVKRRRLLTLQPLTSYPPGVSVLDLERIVIVRDAEGLRAMSTICSHMTCALKQNASGFTCPCHGSRFTMEGHVLNGPAERSLTHYQLSVSDAGALQVHLDTEVDAAFRLSADATL